MLLVELGSIIDGVDGELARLRFQDPASASGSNRSPTMSPTSRTRRA